MGDVELIPDFRGWVDSILKIAPKDQRTWKSISSLHGWKVKTHGMSLFTRFFYMPSTFFSMLIMYPSFDQDLVLEE